MSSTQLSFIGCVQTASQDPKYFGGVEQGYVAEFYQCTIPIYELGADSIYRRQTVWHRRYTKGEQSGEV